MKIIDCPRCEGKGRYEGNFKHMCHVSGAAWGDTITCKRCDGEGKLYLRIKTTFENPPVPSRAFDWSAIDDATYDGPDGLNRIGFGPTPEAAIADLVAQIEEAA